VTETHFWEVATSLSFGITMAIMASLLFDFLDRRKHWTTGAIVRRASQLGLQLTYFNYLQRIWFIFVILVGTVLALVFQMIPIAITLCLLLLTVPSTVLSIIVERHRIRMRDQVVAASRALVSQYRAGKTLSSGIAALAKESEPPLATEFGRCVQSENLGETIEDALTAMKDRLNIEAISLFIVTLLVCDKRGGRVTDAVEKISFSLEQLQQIEQKRDTNTAGGRALVAILAAFPAVFAGMFFVIDPQSMSLVFTTFVGQIMLSATIILTYIAVQISNWIVASIE